MQNIKTNDGKDITFNYLSVAINDMVKKHPLCRWKNKKINGKKFYVLIEGYYWLIYVYFQYENSKCKISKEGIEWLCKNYFKQKYLKLLEQYKMELTEKYIKAGYPYDNHFRLYMEND